MFLKVCQKLYPFVLKKNIQQYAVFVTSYIGNRVFTVYYLSIYWYRLLYKMHLFVVRYLFRDCFFVLFFSIELIVSSRDRRVAAGVLFATLLRGHRTLISCEGIIFIKGLKILLCYFSTVNFTTLIY